MNPRPAGPENSGIAHSPSLLARNSLILIGVEVLAKALGMLVFVLLARKVGATDLGVYAFAVSLSNLAALFPRYGFEGYVQRELPRAPKTFPHLWATIVAIKVPLYAIAVGSVFVALWLGQVSTPKSWVVLLVLTSTLLYEFLLFHAACFRAFQRAEYVAQVRLAYSGSYAVLGLLALRAGFGVPGVAAVLVIVGVIAVIHSAWLLHRRVHPLALFVDPGAIRSVLKESLPFFLLVLVILLYNQIDIVLLSFLSGDREVGVYAAATKIFEATGLIPAGVMGTVLPALAHDWAVSRPQFAATFQAAFKYLTMLGLPLAAGSTICAAKLIHLLYGSQYEPSIAVLRILIWTVVFCFWNYLLFTALIAMDRERDLVKIGAGGVGINIVMNLVLIPRYGALGSSATMVITQAFLFLLALRAVLRGAKNNLDLPMALFNPALCTGAMAVILWLIRGSPLPLLISVGIGVYFAALLARGAVRPAQLKALLGRGE
jgi:O-antigen/teichoic acid export membrane protein